MGMYDDFLDILNVLRNDETLLRLLYYPPEDLAKKILDPLDVNLGNVLDKPRKELQEIRNDLIMKSAKTDDLAKRQICRIYVYAGRRNSNNGNFLFANQEVIFDVLCHNDIENGDLRSTRIADRLNQLFALENIVGIGKMQYYGGNPINTPKEYIGFQHIFKTVGFQKD